MATVITRYFDSTQRARTVVHELVHRQRFSRSILRTLDRSEGLADVLTKAGVDADTARAYQERMAADGGSVLMVRAGHKPLGVAKTTREVTAAMGAIALDGRDEEFYVKDDQNPLLSVMPDAPLMLSRPRDPDSSTQHMADWPFPLILRRPPFQPHDVPGHNHLLDFAIPLLDDRKPFTGSIFPRHARMANFPLPLISRRKPFTGSIFGRHARMANFPIPLISRRQPRNRSIIGRHTRMANWPFPHLINGKQGTNALMPGGPRMANFPISLLSRRKPFTGSIFGRHARMANFPIPLISHRKPYTGSIVGQHARMADMMLPLVVKHSEPSPNERKDGFSLSKMFGLPTLVRR